MRLIDADALVNRLEDWRGDKEDVDPSDPHDIGYYAAMGRAIRFAKESSTMDAVPVVHAQWKYKVAYTSFVHISNLIYCTACGGGFHRIDGINFRYCPNCGARMDGDPHDDRGQ